MTATLSSNDAPVVGLDSQPVKPAPDEPRELHTDYVKVVRAGLDMLNARMLLLLALIVGAGLWFFAVWQPDQLRLITVSLYTVGIFIPLVVLHMKRGN